MQPIRPNQIDAALLYQDYEPFEFGPLENALKLIVGDHMPVHLGVHQDGKFGVISVGGTVVKISQNDHPLEAHGFGPALASPFTQMICSEAQSIVERHRKTIFVTVGDDSIVTSDIAESDIVSQLRDVLGDDVLRRETPSKEVFSNWVFIARIVVSQIINIRKPELVHWCQSDQFFRASEMDPSADPRGMIVQIHPNLFSSGADEKGVRKVGFHAFGAEHVTGYHLLVQETPLPLGDVLKVVHEFVYGLSQDASLPPSGHVVQMKSGAALRIHVKDPDDVHPRKYLEVEVLEVSSQSSKQMGPDRTAGSDRAASGLQSINIKSIFQGRIGKILIGIGLIYVLGWGLGLVILALWYVAVKFK